MAMVLIFIHVCLISKSGIFRVSCMMLREWVCIVARASVVMTINGATVHPWLRILSRSGWYFVALFMIVFNP
jgi:hypothetical protein